MRRNTADPVCPPAVRARLRVGALGAVRPPRAWLWVVGAVVSSVALAGGLYKGAGLGRHADPQAADNPRGWAAPHVVADPISEPVHPVYRSDPTLDSGEEGELAAPVSAFVDSIGVNVRLRRYPGVFAVVKERLHELGIGHVADVSTSRLDLLADLGVRAQLWIWPGQDISALTRGGSALATRAGLF